MIKKGPEKGFTLVELLVVIAIISLFLSMSMAVYNNAKAKSRDAQRLKLIEQLHLGVALYHSSNESYPVCDPETVINAVNDCLTNALSSGNFMQKMPVDPLGGSAGSCGDPDSYIFCYHSADGNSYNFRYNLETNNLGTQGWNTSGL